jgi:hypothetical protein
LADLHLEVSGGGELEESSEQGWLAGRSLGVTKLLPLHIVTGKGKHPHHLQKRLRRREQGQQRVNNTTMKPLVRPAVTDFLDSLEPPLLWRYDDANNGRVVIDAKLLAYWLKKHKKPLPWCL